MEKMTMAEWRTQMYKWTKKANFGDKVQLTHNGEVILTIVKGDEDE